MPLGNGTGPAGMGPMTGRAAGYCAGYPAPGYMNPIPGLGYGGGVAYYGGAFPTYGAMQYGMYRMSGYPGYYPGMAVPWGFGRGLGRGFGRSFGRGFIRGRRRW